MALVTRLFPKATMVNILWEDEGEVLSNEIVSRSRWALEHRLIFRWEGNLYQSNYSVGATESQDLTPWEHDGDEILCYQVREVLRAVIDYELVHAEGAGYGVTRNRRDEASEVSCG